MDEIFKLFGLGDHKMFIINIDNIIGIIILIKLNIPILLK